MLSPHIRILIVVGLIMAGTICCAAQLPDPIFPKGDPKEEEKPKSFQESLEKMRIEKDKKDHDQMVERGVEIVKISEELEKAVDQNGHLTDKDVSKVATVEKLVKKIRSELGGADDDDNDVDDDAEPQKKELSAMDAVKSLRSTTLTLFDELKKTTRFTISATAIQASNSVLKLARFLKITH